MPPNDDGILLPIQVGKTLTDLDLQIQGDDTLNGQPCDNISHKHDYYSELTGLYWAWKNLKKLYPDVKYVGWSHYRRFFAFDERKYFAVFMQKLESEISNYRVDSEKVIKILESGRIIAIAKFVFSCYSYLQYCQSCHSQDYYVLRDVFMNKFPDYYDDFIHVMERNNKLSTCNMFIMKYEDFEKYCEWLFSVLAEVEPLIPYQSYNAYQKRVFAFIAERLLDVYMHKHRIRAKYFNYYLYGNKSEHQKPLRKILSTINRFLFVSKCNFSIFIMNLSLEPLRRLIKKFPLMH